MNSNFSIAPLIIIALFAAFILSTFRAEIFPASGQFVVDHAEERKGFTEYRFCPTSGAGAFWLQAEHGAYHIGDTIVICKKN